MHYLIAHPLPSPSFDEMVSLVARPCCIVLCLLAFTVRSWGADTTPSAENLPPPPVREFRAAWIATVANIDWPSKPGLPVAQQKAELLSLLDRAHSLHFNAIFFQVRTVSDAFYPSPIEPWSEYLTGTLGQRAGTVLRSARICRSPKRTSADWNCTRGSIRFAPGIRIPNRRPPPTISPRTHPELVRHYGDQIWLDPGEPATQAHALAVILDVVKRYDVDGVVFDDYFYPYPDKEFARTRTGFSRRRELEKIWHAQRPDARRLAARKREPVHAECFASNQNRETVGAIRHQPVRHLAAAKSRRRSRASTPTEKFTPTRACGSRTAGWIFSRRNFTGPSRTANKVFRCCSIGGARKTPRPPCLRRLGGFFHRHKISCRRNRAADPNRPRATSDPGEIHYHLRSVLENPALADAVHARNMRSPRWCRRRRGLIQRRRTNRN